MPQLNHIDSLRDLYGSEFVAADVRGYCASEGVTYQTVTKHLEQYKVGRGKWNLEVTQDAVETIESAFEALLLLWVWCPPRMITLFLSATSLPSRRSSSLRSSIPPSSLVFLAMVKPLESNKHVLNSDEKSFESTSQSKRTKMISSAVSGCLTAILFGTTEPVVSALRRGALLLLDEIDLASNKILCLQSILEGNGVFIKKTGEYINPAPGFNVIATANTKGKGSDDGRFVGTNVLNEAFLERFALTFEQEYPTPATETKILNKICSDAEFCQRLADWADIIRKTFYDGGIDEVISTRRLVHIIAAYKIFDDKAKAIQLCLNRFDDETKQAFIDLYDKVDSDVDMNQQEEV